MERQFTAKVSGAVPRALFAVITTHFIFVQAGRGGHSTVERRKQALAVNQMMYIREIISTDYTLGRHHTPCPPCAKPGFPCRDYWLSHSAAGSSS